MPIEHESAVLNKAPTGYLEVDPRWLAGLFGLAATGEVRVLLGKIHVGVQHPTLTAGQVVEGHLTHAFVPMGFGVKP